MRQLRLVPAHALPDSGIFGRDLNPQDYRRHLGQTRHSLFWDATRGLYPNAFAALAATLADGHDLLLHLPEHYPQGDPDHLRLADYGTDANACAPHFNQRLIRLAAAPASAAVANPPDRISHSRTPQIILGRRGRGKTTRLAAKIRWLGAETILVITPFRSNLERLQTLLPDAANLIFLPPDDALNRLPAAAHLIIDEAAAIPAAQLLALTAHYPAYTLASSEDGYEGHGRDFTLRTLPALIQRDDADIQRHQQSLRHTAFDALETLLERAFLLNPAPLATAPAAPITIRAIRQHELAADDNLLTNVYALLHQAHYRTTPEDLKRLLDLPKQTLLVASAGAAIIGVLHLLHESALPDALARAVIRGERRPQGRLLLQQLLRHTQNLAYNQALARVSRIAVHRDHRRHGIASALIHHARQTIREPLGVSYGHDDALAAFWQAQGFTEIYRSPTAQRPTSLRLCTDSTRK
ncbi:MAG: GNAT family N-acetyltransferase [Cardiobacteriaceae bacterium]|nr:GNAT family N-acetyltransferase [Cardiobacteriaceae bacterium]